MSIGACYRNKGLSHFDDNCIGLAKKPKLFSLPSKQAVIFSNDHFFYVMASGIFLKLGNSKNPYSRLSQIQSSNPNPVVLLVIEPFESKGAALFFEKMCHERYKKYNVHGEWFRMDPTKIRAFLNAGGSRKAWEAFNG